MAWTPRGVADPRGHRTGVDRCCADPPATGEATPAGPATDRPDKPPSQVTEAVNCASNDHVGIVGDVLTHVAVSVGNLIGVAIRLGHGGVGRTGTMPSMETATPVRGLPSLGPAR